MATRGGRKNISEKPKSGTNVSFDELFGNNLTISPELKAELDAKGLIPRWVDARTIKEFNGYHPKGWRIYKRDQTPGTDAMEFAFGNDPTGVVRRGSVVLAVKTKEDAAKHRDFLNARAEQNRNISTEKAKELKEFARQSGINTTVIEGYDDDEGT